MAKLSVLCIKQPMSSPQSGDYILMVIDNNDLSIYKNCDGCIRYCFSQVLRFHARPQLDASVNQILAPKPMNGES